MAVCECGCGRETKPNRRFIHGHNKTHTGPRIPKPPPPNPSGLCMCGCGQKTAISRCTMRREGVAYGEHVRYVRFHQPRPGSKNLKRGRPWFSRHANRWFIYGRDGRRIRWARIVLEDKLGRLLLDTEEAHHINGDMSDDRPENLMALSKADHARLHANLLPKTS